MSGAFSPPAHTKTPPCISAALVSRKPSVVASAIFRVGTHPDTQIGQYLGGPVDQRRGGAGPDGMASLDQDHGWASGTRRWLRASSGSISASSPASSTR